MHQKYVSDTKTKTKEHKELFELNKKNSQEIEKYVRSIANKRAKNDMMKIKIKAHEIECIARN